MQSTEVSWDLFFVKSKNYEILFIANASGQLTA